MVIKKKIFESLSPEEIAESYVLPTNLCSKEREAADADFLEIINKRRATRNKDQDLKFRLLQFKILIEDYINSDHYNPDYNFSYFLNQYIDLINKTQQDFANDIDISKYQLNHYCHNRREPNESIMVRLEIHSNNTIPAIHWLKVLEKQKEHLLNTNQLLRKVETKHVNNKLEVVL
jgi:transcriptional regulator with XRE-family HTH domain